LKIKIKEEIVMKRTLVFLLVLSMVFAFAACAADEPAVEETVAPTT
jgi:hypothetical protein